MSDALVKAVTRYTEAQAGESPFVTAVEGLTEARGLMMADAAHVETTAFAVGYGSPSPFSRKCSRMSGAPRHGIVGLRRRVRPQRERKKGDANRASPFR